MEKLEKIRELQRQLVTAKRLHTRKLNDYKKALAEKCCFPLSKQIRFYGEEIANKKLELLGLELEKKENELQIASNKLIDIEVELDRLLERHIELEPLPF